MNKRLEYMRKYREAKKKLCPKCNEKMISSGATQCRSCAGFAQGKDITLAEAIYTTHHRSSAYALIRGRARSVYKDRPCESCGYDKHTEVCHITPIASFPDTALISEVNHQDNLIRLCPNCHWEHDNGLLTLDR